MPTDPVFHRGLARGAPKNKAAVMAFKFLSAFPSLLRLGSAGRKGLAHSLYGQMVGAARAPHFFTVWAVPDTEEGRFDVLSLHAWLTFRRLATVATDQRLGQAVFDVMFDDLDGALRELGVGDTRVPKRVRTLAEEYSGASRAYEEAWDDDEALKAAIGRNVLKDPSHPAAGAIADYARQADLALSAAPDDQVLSGVLPFPSPPNSPLNEAP